MKILQAGQICSVIPANGLKRRMSLAVLRMVLCGVPTSTVVIANQTATNLLQSLNLVP